MILDKFKMLKDFKMKKLGILRYKLKIEIMKLKD